MTSHVYLALFEAEPDGGFSVSFPDVPGAVTQGDNFAEATRNAEDALELILQALNDDGVALPQASPAEKLPKGGPGPVVVAIVANI